MTVEYPLFLTPDFIVNVIITQGPWAVQLHVLMYIGTYY